MAFAGMMGRVLAQTMLRQQAQRNVAANAAAGAGYRGSFRSSGKYLFVAHPKCCLKCTHMNGTLWNTPDVSFISHPNCKCATIEAPDGLSPAELMDWTRHPVGMMRFGFNYGVPLKPVSLTNDNRDNVFAKWHERMDPESAKAHPRRRVRAIVSQTQIDAIRERVKSGELTQGTNLTRRIQGLIDAQKTRALKNTEAGKLASKLFGNDTKSRIVVSQGRNRQRSGALELPKLRKGTTWNPNGKKASTQNQRKNGGNTAVSPRNGYGNEPETLKRISPKADNVQFTAALMGAARMLRGSRSKAMKSYTERQKRKKQEEKERLERLRKIGLM